MAWEQHKKGAEIASFCTGAFLLAAAGLLNGKEATTHIDSAHALASNFPAIILKSDAVVTEDKGFYERRSYQQLSSDVISDSAPLRKRAYFENRQNVRDRYGPRAADLFRDVCTVTKSWRRMVNMAQQKIEKLYQEGSTIETLIQDIPASRRNVVRRFKQAIGVTPIEYLQRTRIEAAKKLLAQTDQSVLEVMLNSGYNDLKSFRQLFKKSTGVTPKEYRDKFNISRLETAGRMERRAAI
jgi:transcriptional regulator GlxA family with amidase domain